MDMPLKRGNFQSHGFRYSSHARACLLIEPQGMKLTGNEVASRPRRRSRWGPGNETLFLYSHLPGASSTELCATGCDVNCSLQGDDRFTYGLHLTFHKL